jgi:mono/diheme cytochrome c family protein
MHKEATMKRLLSAVMTTAVLFGPLGVAWSAEAPAVYGKKCKACHSIGGVGGPMAKLGGPLDGVGAKHDQAWLKAYLKDPKSKIPNAKMPKQNLPDEDVNALAAYLVTLKTPPAAK